MKTDVMPSIVQMETKELRNLVKEVKETVATNVVLHSVKQIDRSFGIVDLWNMRRNMKTARRLWGK
jgi:translation elongation factor EF-1beta